MTWDKKTRTCWTIDGVRNVTAFEAIVPPTGVFNATHSPLPLVRRTAANPRSGGVVADESSLFHDFYESPSPDGVLVLPIIGTTGTGKSHLIRFLYVNRPIDDSAHIVWIPKTDTNLRGAIGRVLEGLDTRFDQIREQLAGAQAESLTADEAESRFLHELQQVLQSRATDTNSGDTVADRSLVAQAAVLMDDSQFRSILRTHGGPQRLVSGPLGVKNDADDELAAQFFPDDIPFLQIDRRTLAEEPGKAFNQFATMPATQLKFLEFLNQSIERAIQAVFWRNGPKMTDLMEQIRRLLHTDGRQLYLLIEDMVVLSGVQGELLQALITPAVQAPGEPPTLAPIRTAFAMTDGPFQSVMDTVTSRVGSLYAITLPRERSEQDPSIFGDDEQVAFLARYLNAARHTDKELDDFEAQTFGTRLASRCDGCQVADKCLPEFGQADGIGLYPFNREALVAMSKAVSEKVFNPRKVILAVLRDVLMAGLEDIKSNRFPADATMDPFKNDTNQIDVEVSVGIRKRFPEAADQRINLQRFWSKDQSDRTIWSQWLSECFGLEPENDGTKKDETPLEQPEDNEPQPSPPDPLQYLNNWYENGGNVIPENDARRLRTALYEIVSGQLHDRHGIETVAPLFHAANGDFMSRGSFNIPNALGREGGSKWEVSITATPETALMFRRIFQNIAGTSVLGAEDLQELLAFVEPFVESAHQQYKAEMAAVVPRLGRLAYLARNLSSPGRGIDAILDVGLEAEITSQGRSSSWQNLLMEARASRERDLEQVLAVYGSAKGSGGVLSTRVAVLLPQLADVRDKLIDDLHKAATHEYVSDAEKIAEIRDVLGDDPIKTLTSLSDSFTTVRVDLPGRIVADQLLINAIAELKDLVRSWDEEVLLQGPRDTPEQELQSVASKDVSKVDNLLTQLKTLVALAEDCTATAESLARGDGSSSIMGEIETKLGEIETMFGGI